MHSMAWVLWSSVLGCLLYLGATQTCSKIALKNAGNLLTNPTTIAEFQTAELTTCVRECMFRSGCKSVSYDRDLGVCQLTPLDSQVNATTFEANPRYIYTDMSEWPVTLAGMCASNPCPPEERCVPWNTGSMCITPQF